MTAKLIEHSKLPYTFVYVSNKGLMEAKKYFRVLVGRLIGRYRIFN